MDIFYLLKMWLIACRKSEEFRRRRLNFLQKQCLKVLFVKKIEMLRARTAEVSSVLVE